MTSQCNIDLARNTGMLTPCPDYGVCNVGWLMGVVLSLVGSLPSLSHDEQSYVQQGGADLAQVIRRNEGAICNPHCQFIGCKPLWTQHDYLAVDNGVLFRKWEDVLG